MKRVFVQLLVSAFLLGWAATYLDWTELFDVATKVRPSTIVLSLVAIQLSFACAAARWVRLLKGTVDASTGHHLTHYYRSVFFNFFSPGNLAGDAYRIVAFRTRAGGLGVMLVAVLKERVLGIVSFSTGLIVCVFAVLASFASVPEAFIGYLAISTLGAVALLSCVVAGPYLLEFVQPRISTGSGRTETIINGIRQALRFGDQREFAILMVYSMAALACWLAAVQFLASDLAIGLPIFVIASIAIVTELARLVPISFQGIGVREGTFAALVGLCGADPETGFMLGAISYLVLSLSLIIAGGAAIFLDLFVIGDRSAVK